MYSKIYDIEMHTYTVDICTWAKSQFVTDNQLAAEVREGEKKKNTHITVA